MVVMLQLGVNTRVKKCFCSGPSAYIPVRILVPVTLFDTHPDSELIFLI